MLDLLAISHAITEAIAVCDLVGRREVAEVLRVHGPELLGLARRGSHCRDCEFQPTDADPPTKGHLHG